MSICLNIETFCFWAYTCILMLRVGEDEPSQILVHAPTVLWVIRTNEIARVLHLKTTLLKNFEQLCHELL